MDLNLYNWINRKSKSTFAHSEHGFALLVLRWAQCERYVPLTGAQLGLQDDHLQSGPTLPAEHPG